MQLRKSTEEKLGYQDHRMKQLEGYKGGIKTNWVRQRGTHSLNTLGRRTGNWEQVKLITLAGKASMQEVKLSESRGER